MSHRILAAGSDAINAHTIHREDRIIQQAIALLEQRIFNAGPILTRSDAVCDYLRLKLAALPNEVFAVIFLDNRSRVIAYEPMFQGTVDQTIIFPRVVARRGLELNASSVILAHQHPSGVVTPSLADRAITKKLKAALATVEIKVLDHFIVGEGSPYSFAEAGIL
ncbi:JAB domain-containing protein [Ralstonia pseudosolanacearum]|uniref:JAB domain-containing protein n=1 Tax=Ralstonia pseudosolanacearum TaxID=1310165 RepID=UPI0040547F32